MNLNDVAKSFSGVKRGHGMERHSIKSLSRRLMLSRQTVRRALKGGELEFEARFSAGKNGSTYEFKSAHLDSVREQVVDQIIEDIQARLQGLDMTEQEMVLAALHGLRSQKADVEHEFASKPNDPDDDDNDNEVAKLIGGVGGAIGGGLIGGKAGALGLIGGAAVGGTVGSQAAGNEGVRDVAVAGGLGGLGYLAHKSILGAGGYAKVAADTGIAGTALKGRMMDAIRAALGKVAEAEV
jgi:hypothetical protein